MLQKIKKYLSIFIAIVMITIIVYAAVHMWAAAVEDGK